VQRESRAVRFDAESGAWLLTRHADCVTALRDRRFSAELGQGRRRRADSLPPTMLNTDPPEHHRLRAPAAPLVAQARVRRCIGQVAAASEHFANEAVARGEVDAIAGYAAPIAAVTLATLLGVPPAELITFTRLARAAAINLDPLADGPAAIRGRDAAAELVEYLRAVIAERRIAADGGIAALAGLDRLTRRSQPETHEPSLDETLATLALVVVGGFEPLVHLVGNGLDTLVRRPGQLDRLRADPELWPTAIDELLRWESPIPFTARVCRTDAVIGGQCIRAGEMVVALLAAGNRDPATFTDPGKVDVGRSPNLMLAFGAGPHVCLAAPLARVVGRIALATALARFKTITLLDDQPAWRDCLVPRGLAQLPIRIG
jgi:cytochrome P450